MHLKSSDILDKKVPGMALAGYEVWENIFNKMDKRLDSWICSALGQRIYDRERLAGWGE